MELGQQLASSHSCSSSLQPHVLLELLSSVWAAQPTPAAPAPSPGNGPALAFSLSRAFSPALFSQGFRLCSDNWNPLGTWSRWGCACWTRLALGRDEALCDPCAGSCSPWPSPAPPCRAAGAAAVFNCPTPVPPVGAGAVREPWLHPEGSMAAFQPR